ncbi:uncharacterized protein BO80DRAFT_351329 [Aspergillus ibericus CBS 121593]|uniref:Fe2OG dioxygenase domain-containing protein n=1 Tax=Aspergillus ibericus CBS 121593 TaxID=1448316 RepID=A0A395H5U8_9EURO|nr:hypothetical protein BO80DRAFT_351329 [Aspergillus ibericus CBS 121593]RAL02993.1 hypothetical protein BO80DRAFT_351329 [Aspergillus ibericus CBS 121593]
MTEESFDPKIHLTYTPPTTKYTFDDLSLAQFPTATPIAASTPFPFLTPAGILAYRKALTSPAIAHHCAHSPYKNTLVLRNVAKYSSFIHDLWTHPETLRIIADVAGVPLVPIMKYEIGHTNIQANGTSVEEMLSELTAEPATSTVEVTEAEKSQDPVSGRSVIPWHYDSYPYVLIVMLSHTTGMYGGETCLRTGDGSALKIITPPIGHAIFLQGGEIQHLASRAIGTTERITTITSLRATTPGLYDNSYLTNVRPESDLGVLYREWVRYRVAKVVEEMGYFEGMLEGGDEKVDVETVHRVLETQIGYLRRTVDQVVSYELHDAVIGKYGVHAYYAAEEYWEQVQKCAGFGELVRMSEEKREFRPGSRLWADLYASRMMVENGGVLRGQVGVVKWDNERDYVMGDELLRQGLREVFWEWVGVVGLDELLEVSDLSEL